MKTAVIAAVLALSTPAAAAGAEKLEVGAGEVNFTAIAMFLVFVLATLGITWRAARRTSVAVRSSRVTVRLAPVPLESARPRLACS